MVTMVTPVKVTIVLVIMVTILEVNMVEIMKSLTPNLSKVPVLSSNVSNFPL